MLNCITIVQGDTWEPLATWWLRTTILFLVECSGQLAEQKSSPDTASFYEHHRSLFRCDNQQGEFNKCTHCLCGLHPDQYLALFSLAAGSFILFCFLSRKYCCSLTNPVNNLCFDISLLENLLSRLKETTRSTDEWWPTQVAFLHLLLEWISIKYLKLSLSRCQHQLSHRRAEPHGGTKPSLLHWPGFPKSMGCPLWEPWPLLRCRGKAYKEELRRKRRKQKHYLKMSHIKIAFSMPFQLYKTQALKFFSKQRY